MWILLCILFCAWQWCQVNYVFYLQICPILVGTCYYILFKNTGPLSAVEQGSVEFCTPEKGVIVWFTFSAPSEGEGGTSSI